MQPPKETAKTSSRHFIENVRLLELNDYEANGHLVPVEEFREVPFEIKRIFYVYGVSASATRGDHAHRDCSQALICLSGKVEVTCDDGSEKKQFTLDSPRKCLVIPPGIWARETYEDERTVLIVLSDRCYDPAEYIRDYTEYTKFRKANA